MSDPIQDIKSLIRILNSETDRAHSQMHNQHNQIVYLSDKFNRLFHALREFNTVHGRDLHPDVLDAFNAAWRSHEASFDTWQSYQKDLQEEPNSHLTTEID
jgi:hypothetical protein